MSGAGWVAGGCLCGAVRYEVNQAGVFDAGYCHCAMCRRLHAAPVVAWATVKREAFRITSGAPAHFQSSPAGRRSFCPVCGSQLLFDGPEMELAGLTGFLIFTLDESAPPPLRPRLHMCMANKLDWFTVQDDLPQFPDNQPTHPDKR